MNFSKESNVNFCLIIYNVKLYFRFVHENNCPQTRVQPRKDYVDTI